MTGPRRRRRGTGPAPRKVEIRLSVREHESLRAAATTRSISVARFVAESALAAAGAAPPPPPRRGPSRLALAEIADAVAAVNRVGNNLNQLARERNIIGDRPVGTADATQRALIALERLADVVETRTPPS